MKAAQYKVIIGSFYDQSGKEFTQGQIVESYSDLITAFPNKFTLVRPADYTPEAPVATPRAIVQPIQPTKPVEETAPAVPVAPEKEEETAEPSAPENAEPPKKKRKTVNLD